MDKYTTFDSKYNFVVAMSDSVGDSFDNAEAIGTRYCLVLIENGTGIAMFDEHAIPYIAPCVFCANEKEHLIIQKTDKASVRVIYFHPCTVNSIFDFNNIDCLPEDSPFTLYQDYDLVKYFLIRKDDYHGKFNLGPVSLKKFQKIFVEIHTLLIKQTTNWPCKSRSYLFELLFYLDKLYETDSFTKEPYMDSMEEEFQSIILYIHQNYEKKLTVQDITEQFHMSKTTLAKMFQSNLDETFLSYLNKLRIRIAATMLRDTLLPVNDIMTRVGFYDNAHFLRTFKRYTGFSPSAYREKYCWM